MTLIQKKNPKAQAFPKAKSKPQVENMMSRPLKKNICSVRNMSGLSYSPNKNILIFKKPSC